MPKLSKIFSENGILSLYDDCKVFRHFIRELHRFSQVIRGGQWPLNNKDENGTIGRTLNSNPLRSSWARLHKRRRLLHGHIILREEPLEDEGGPTYQMNEGSQGASSSRHSRITIDHDDMRPVIPVARYPHVAWTKRDSGAYHRSICSEEHAVCFQRILVNLRYFVYTGIRTPCGGQII